MSLDIDALLQPLSDSTKAQEPRESPVFTEMEREIDKLSSLSSDSLPNWTRIEQLACEYFSQQAKDYLVASWLSEAWTQRHAMLGVNAGLGLFAGLSEKFWQQGIPPVTRLRGRRNAMLWWIDRLCDWLEKQSNIVIGADLAETMIANAQSLDAALAEKDPDAPSLVRLLSLLKRIPVEQQQTTSVNETASSSPEIQPSVNSITAPSVTPTVSHSSTSSASASVSNLKSPSFSGKIEINSMEDVVKLLQPAQDYISQIGPALFEFNNTHPLGIYLTRFAARASIFEIPPASNGQTTIPPPPASTVDSFEKVVGLKNPLGLVDFCESRISTFPFWFDLDYQSARGFGMMGSAGARAREAIIDMVLSFVNKIPNIEQFTFSDGMPFASLETLTWIKQCKEDRSGHVHQDAFSEIRSQAQAQIGEGQFEQGLNILHEYIDGNRSRREQFRARLILVQMILSQDAQADVLSFVEPLIDDCVRNKLDQWEPELASQAWELKVRAARQVMMSTRTDIDIERRSKALREYETALKHLSSVDFVAANRLTL
jgi:type VI secretion system protein VasJ